MHENGLCWPCRLLLVTEKQPAPYLPFQNKGNFMSHYDNIGFTGITDSQSLVNTAKRVAP